MQGLKINPEQLKAIKHKSGPVLVVAGAGTGKTTVITERIRWLLSTKKALPKEILALTFTEKAAEEMLSRVDEVMPLGYEEPWLSTFHSFCDKILRHEALEIGLDPSFKILTEPEQWLLIRKHLFEFDLKYYRPLGNPTKFISALIQLFSRAKDEIITAEDFLKYAQKQKTINKKQLTKNNNDNAEQEEKEKLLEVAHAYKKYQELLIAENALDFGDLLLWVIHLFKNRPSILKKYQQQFKYILIDEFQDTNLAQFEIVKLLAPSQNNPNLMVVGDDDQCLPAGTLVRTPNGVKKIETSQIGDPILTAVGHGQVAISKITNVFQSRKKTRLLTIKTALGKRITVTDNHKMFCFLPAHSPIRNRWYVYLMEQKNIGWRIGITNDLAERSRFERQVDRIIGIGSFKTLEEARYQEILYSLKYQIPTVTFTTRENQIIKDKFLTKLMSNLDTGRGVVKLAKDLRIDLSAHHFSPGAVTRGKTKRVKIILKMCDKKYKTRKAKNRILVNPLISHTLYLETTNQEIIHKLQTAGFKLQKAKVGKRLRMQNLNLAYLGTIIKTLQELTNGILEVKFQVGKMRTSSRSALIMPASNLLVGNYIPVFKKNEIYYDRIVDIQEKNSYETVYDLEIDRTHNFIADDIVVHNSIYKFRGAAITNILEFKKIYPSARTVVLTKNYRSTQKILDSAYQLIQNNNPDRLEKKLKIDKHLKAIKDVSGEYPLILETDNMEQEADLVAQKILELKKTNNYNYSDSAILARANNHLDAFVASFKRNGLPYSLIGNRGLFDQEEIRGIISFLRFLVNEEDNVSLYQLMISPLFNFKPEEITMILTQARKNKTSLWQILKTETDKIPSVEKLLKIISELKQKIHKNTVTQILYEFLIKTSYMKTLLKEETIENSLKIKNINLFFAKVKSFETQTQNPHVFEFIDYLELLLEAGENPAQAEIEDIDTVKLLTVHSAKGLEFPVVFITNLVVDRFPSRARAEALPLPDDLIKEKLPTGDYHLSEERRLFYVGVTRSRDFLFLTWAKNYGGVREKKPSGFLSELKTERPIVQPTSNFQLPISNSSISASHLPLSISSFPLPISHLKYISYSQLETFQTCPLKYYYKYLVGVTGVPNAALSFGQIVHRTLRDFHKIDFLNKKKTIDHLLGLYKNHWQELSVGFLDSLHREKAYKHGEEILEKYFLKHKKLFATPVYLEQTFTIRIGGVFLRGSIDRIDRYKDGSYEVIDYKTGEGHDEKKAEKDEQLTIYAIACYQSLGISPKNYTLYFIEKDVKSTSQRTPEQLNKQKEEIKKIVEEIKTSKFSPKIGRWCKWCEFNKICPAYKVGQNNF